MEHFRLDIDIGSFGKRPFLVIIASDIPPFVRNQIILFHYFLILRFLPIIPCDSEGIDQAGYALATESKSG